MISANEPPVLRVVWAAVTLFTPEPEHRSAADDDQHDE